MEGLLGAAREKPIPTEEVRFGVVLNGGVSLAVWMGGTVHELDRLTKALDQARPEGPYALMLRLAGCTARADVMAGTSAGGINGAALALAQVNRDADLGMLRDLWIEEGRIDSMLRRPFQGDPTSLLKGDEFFLPALNDAMNRLAEARGHSDPVSAPIDLTITATVLGGNQTVSLDSMGQQLPQTVHAGLFHWQRSARSSRAADPFDPANIGLTARQLALASRSTASFPVAFEPSFIPVNSPAFPARADGSSATPATLSQRLRPDMSGVVRSWGAASTSDRSRYVLDGGVLANTPTISALRAVEAMEADGPVRRVMLLVYPHAPSPDEDAPSQFATAPTVAGALSGMLGALTGQGSRTYVDQLEEHNLRAAGRRGTRSDILAVSTPEELLALAQQIYPHYLRLRVWRAGRDLAARLAGTVDDGTTSSRLPEGWNFERVRIEAERAQEEWLREHGSIPYVPLELEAAHASPGWGWGVSGALSIAEASLELLRQVVATLTEVDDRYRQVTAARRTVFELRASIESLRDEVDAAWATDRGDTHDDAIGSLAPNRRYWTLRLAYYDHLMVGTVEWSLVAGLIDEVADWEGRAAGERVPAGSRHATKRAEQRRSEVLAALGERLTDGGRPPGAVGQQVALLVDAVVEQLRRVVAGLDLDALDEGCLAYREVRRWAGGLGLSEPLSAEVLLDRLTHLEVAATALGDEVSSGASIPVELVQLSAQTANRFAEHSRTADDKLGGWSLNRFGGFLKRSWRANDWTWGRMDAATVLCRTVLHPNRIRRTARLTGYLDAGTPQELADATVEELVRELLGDPRPELGPLVAEAKAELTVVFDRDLEDGDIPTALPAFADLFARAVHEQVVVAELPGIAQAIRADKVEGGYQRSRGEVFLATEGPLLTRLDAVARGGQEPLSGVERDRALAAFDAAGIGRESLADESTSDLSIRTAATAAAVAATVLSSARSGLKAVAPATRALRGLMLLPYWVVAGLTGKGGVARGLSLLGLGLGATVLALSLFGALPESISGPATALGASAVLVAFAYAALRTGTILHGVVLLSPVIPLLTYSVLRAQDVDDASGARGSTTLLVVIGLAIVLMLLGSFGAAYGSVWAALDGLADRRGVRPTTTASGGAARPRPPVVRWAAALGLTVWPVLAALGGLAILAGAVTWALRSDWVEAMQDWSWSPVLKWGVVALVVLAATGLGTMVASKAGKSLCVLARVPREPGTSTDPGDEGFTWCHQQLVNPRGVAIGWSVLYGVGYELLAVALLADPFDQHDQWWHRVALVTAVLFAIALVLVVPWLLPLLEYAAIRRAEALRAPTVVDPTDYALDLAARGLGFRRFVAEGSEPTLTRAGTRLRDAVFASREDPPQGR